MRQLTPSLMYVPFAPNPGKRCMYCDSAYCTSLAGTPDGVISRLFCLARISIQETLHARLGLYGRGLFTVCAFLVWNLPLSMLLWASVSQQCPERITIHLPLNNIDAKNRPSLWFLWTQDGMNLACGALWSTAYILYIRQSFRDESYGMSTLSLSVYTSINSMLSHLTEYIVAQI